MIRTRRSRVVLLSCALAMSLGCAMPTGIDAEGVGSEQAELILSPIGNPDFVCEYRMSMSVRDDRGFPYCADADLTGNAVDWSRYRRLIIAQHGRGGNGGGYRDTLGEAVEWAESQSIIRARETFVLAPQFLASQDVADQGLAPWQMDELIWWQQTGTAETDWTTAGLSSPGMSYSSFAVLDQLIEVAMARMPNLTEIIFTGQSAGGQTTQRYAMLNDLELPPGAHIRYLPANPYMYTYPTPHRPLASGDGFQWIPNPDPDAGPYPWTDLEVCDELAGQPMAADFHDYATGLGSGLPVPYLGPDADAQANMIAWRYAGRDVTYLIGEADVTHEEQCGGGIQAQGRHRRERALAFHELMGAFGADHSIAVVPDQGHGGSIFDRECTRRVLFGDLDSCEQLEDATGGQGWPFDVKAMAFGGVDSDSADELAIVLASGGQTQLLILDDAASGYAVLHELSLLWPADDVITSIAFGNLVGSNPRLEELVVGRRSDVSPAFSVVRFWGGVDVIAEGPIGLDVEAVAVGNIDDDSPVEIGVTWDTNAGSRWTVYDYVASNLVTVRQGSWSGSARPRGIAFGDVDGDGQDELAVGVNTAFGTRLRLYDGLGGVFMSTQSLGSDWPWLSRVVGFDFGNVDKDGAEELFVARQVQSGARWQLLDDRLSGFAVLEEHGADWPAGAQVTALGTGRPSSSSVYVSVAVARTSHFAERVEHYTYRQLEEPAFGQVTRSGTGLDPSASIRALDFGDVDGHGGGELGFGIIGDLGLGHRFEVIASP